MTNEKLTLKLYNTLTQALEAVVPQDGSTIRLYTCGPTVYDFAHIGNFRTFVFEDLLRRTIRFFGMHIEQVMNITDVDDKTIKGAIAKNLVLDTFTKIYKDAFFEDLVRLNIERVEHYPCATDFIPQMIAMCKTLIEKKAAYVGRDGSVYFAITQFAEYGKLSHLKLDELQIGASQATSDEYTKESPQDFVLWKAFDPERDGSVFWESPWGRGRPGWHLECSVMATTLLGETLDMHAGGVDLIFPHHENEIAQSECCTGKNFCRMWVHAEHLLVDGKKMSKSLGNFYTLRDLVAKGYTGKEVRFLFLQSHYRMQLNFTLQSLDAAKHALSRITDFVMRLQSYTGATHPQRPDIQHFIQEAKTSFTQALSHDLNVPEALGVFFEMIRLVNIFCDEKKLTTQDAKALLALVEEMDSVFGICHVESVEIPLEVQRLVDMREVARKNKAYSEADACRSELLALGYLLEDTPQGVRVKKK